MKQRIITGVIFGIVVLFLVNFTSLTASIFLGIVGVLSLWEYYQMILSKEAVYKSVIYLLISSMLAYILILDEERIISDTQLLYLSTAYVFFGIISLYIKKRIFIHHQFALFHAAFYIVIPFVLLYKQLFLLNIESSEALMTILCFIWISDSAAYFVGSKIGKHKLFESISPGKTWEGSIGAGLIAILVGLIIGFIFPLHGILYWILIAFVIWVIGTYGDLYESSIKRKYNIKDSGVLLPGHGGFLDRFDSFIFVIPIVLLIWKWLEI